MGVSGLLPLLKSIHRNTNLEKYRDEVIGIDGYVWLHRGAHGCALSLIQGNDTRDYIKYALSRIRMMRHFGVNPYFVFDGDFLPSKKMTEDDRSRRRDVSRKAALDLAAAGKASQALQEAQKCVDVTPEMARELITELQRIDVPYIVAPYEADAQLVYLERQGVVTGILSEDSDLLVFGARRLLTKLDQYGDLVEINRRDFAACREVMLTGWSDVEFRRMAILSGCDYMKGLPQVGLKKAHGLIRKYKTPERIVRMVSLEGKIRVPPDFLQQFTQAELTFMHQRVYCPLKQELVFLSDPDPKYRFEGTLVADLPFIGALVDGEMARAVAKGDVNPITKQTMIVVSKSLDSTKRRHSSFDSVHNGSGKDGMVAGGIVRPTSKRPIESYFRSGVAANPSVQGSIVRASSDNRRVPMGEMDTNCFSVDQQRLATLTNHGRSSIVFPLPRPYIDSVEQTPRARVLRRRTEPIGNSLRAMTANHSADHVSDLSTVPYMPTTQSTSIVVASNGRPPKKPRLCVEAEMPSTPTKSKYFSHSASKLFTPRKYTSGSQQTENNLFDFTDIDNWTPMKGKLKDATFSEDVSIFCDPDIDQPSCTPLKTSRMDTTSMSSSAQDDQDSVQLDAGPDMQMTQKPRSRTSIISVLQQHSYTPTTTQLETEPRQLPTPSSSMPSSRNDCPTTSQSRLSSYPRASMSLALDHAHTMPPLSLSPSAPLQRSGTRALGRITPCALTNAQAHFPKVLSDIGMIGKGTLAKRRSLPLDSCSFVPLPRMKLAEMAQFNLPCGSEDLIVPVSDDDAAEPGSDECSSNQDSRLNLASFVYSS